MILRSAAGAVEDPAGHFRGLAKCHYDVMKMRKLRNLIVEPSKHTQLSYPKEAVSGLGKEYFHVSCDWHTGMKGAQTEVCTPNSRNFRGARRFIAPTKRR
jgi:hypothetical protein